MTENAETHIKALYESVGRGFESLPSHQEKPVHIVCWFFFFCLRDGRGSNRAAAHSAASNQPSGLLLSPRVPTRRNVYRGSCKSKDFMAFLFCKPWLHGFCTVFARFQNVQRVQIVAKSDKGCRNSKLKTCDASQRIDDKT